jgi:hypothetical protein
MSPLDTTQTQTQSDTVNVQGPDGKTYGFPKGTTKEAAVAYFKKKNIGVAAKAPPTTQTQPTTKAPKEPGFLEKGSWSGEIARGVRRGVRDITREYPKYAYEASKPRSELEEKQAGLLGPIGGPIVASIGHQYDDLMTSLHRASVARESMAEHGASYADQLRTSLEYGPFGDLAKGIAKGGPEGAGYIAEAITSFGIGPRIISEAFIRGAKPINNIVNDPAKFAADKSVKIDSRYFGSREAGVGVSKAKLQGTLNQLTTIRDPETGITRKGLIRQELDKVNARTLQIVQDHTAQGKTLDILQDVKDLTQSFSDRARAVGDSEALNQIQKINKAGVAASMNARNQFVPRNLVQLSPQDAYLIHQILEKPSFEKPPTQLAQNYAKALRKAIGDHLDSLDPSLRENMRQAHNLIEADEAAQKMHEQQFVGLKRTFASVYRSGSSLGAFVMLRALGMPWAESAATVIGLKAVWDSAPSATARAAAWRTVSEWFDNAQRKSISNTVKTPLGGGPQGPTGAPQLQGGPQLMPQAGGAQGQVVNPQVPAAQQLTAPKKLLALPPSSLEITKVSPETTGVAGVERKMLDRLDELHSRTPKSGAENKSVGKQKKEIAEYFGRDTTQARKSEILAKFRNREAQRAFRGREQAKKPVGDTGVATGRSGDVPTTEPVTSQASALDYVSATEQAYTALAKMPEGKQIVASLKATAKQMSQAKNSGWTAQHEFEAALAAVEFLKGQGAQLSEPEIKPIKKE